MKVLLPLALCLGLGGLISAAQAADVPFDSLFRGQSTVTDALYPNMPTLLFGTVGLRLGLQGIDTTGDGHLGAALLLGDKLQFSALEMTILTQLVGNIATQCFNISPDRLVNISDWLVKRNSLPLVAVRKATFGPLELTYRPWQYSTTQQFASLVLSRRGTPGQDPWINTCLLTGG